MYDDKVDIQSDVEDDKELKLAQYALTREEVQKYLQKYRSELGFFYTTTEPTTDGKVVVYTRFADERMRGEQEFV